MTEDVIEFGADRERGSRRSRARLSRHPQVPFYLAGAGALAAFASLLTPWREFSSAEQTGPESFFLDAYILAKEAWGMSAHPGGTPYLVALIGLVAVIALTLFGAPGVRHTARIAGLALSAATIGLLGAVGYMFTKIDDVVTYFPDALADQVSSAPGPGWWAALAAMLLAGSGLWLSRTPLPEHATPSSASTLPDTPADPPSDGHPVEPRDPRDLELTVSEAPPVRHP